MLSVKIKIMENIRLLADCLKSDPSAKKMSSESLSKKYDVTLKDVKELRLGLRLGLEVDEMPHLSLNRLNSNKVIVAVRENPLLLKSSHFEIAELLNLPPKFIEEILVAEYTEGSFVECTLKKSKDQVEDYLTTLLKERGVDSTQVTPTSMWIKDPKSQTNVHYSINAKVNQVGNEPIDLESIREELVKEITPKILPPYKESEETLLIYIADTHLGCLVESDAQFVSGYTKEMFKERIMNTLKLVKPNQKVYITLLGDILDSVKGLTSRGGHHLPGNMTDKEMYVTFIETFKEYFETLSEITPNFAFVSCGEDNHTGSLNYVISKSLELYLNTRFPTIETHVFEKFIGHFNLNSNGIEHTVMVCHGKDENKLSRNLPFSLTPPVELKINNYMIHNNIPLNTKQVHFVKGDLHRHGSEYSTNGGFRYRNCGSLAMPSAWIQQQTFGNTTSGVSYDIINGTQILEGNLFFS
jgi:hypothetical protein